MAWAARCATHTPEVDRKMDHLSTPDYVSGAVEDEPRRGARSQRGLRYRISSPSTATSGCPSRVPLSRFATIGAPGPVLEARAVTPPQPLSQCAQAGDLVDVYSYDAHAELSQTEKYPYSYPAFVLAIDAIQHVAWVCYLSDGLGVDDGLEAAQLAQAQPAAATAPSAAAANPLTANPLTDPAHTTTAVVAGAVGRCDAVKS